MQAPSERPDCKYCRVRLAEGQVVSKERFTGRTLCNDVCALCGTAEVERRKLLTYKSRFSEEQKTVYRSVFTRYADMK